MIKLLQCVRRPPHQTVAAFRAAWEDYAEHLRETAVELGATRVTLSTTLEIPLNDALMTARGSEEPFDGVAEIVWPNGAAVMAEVASAATRERIARLRGLQETFVDPGRSAFFFVHEQELLSSQG